MAGDGRRRPREAMTAGVGEHAVVIGTEPGAPASPAGPAVVADGLAKRYGKRLAVDGIDFELPAGSSAALSALTVPGRRPRSSCCSA